MKVYFSILFNPFCDYKCYSPLSIKSFILLSLSRKIKSNQSFKTYTPHFFILFKPFLNLLRPKYSLDYLKSHFPFNRLRLRSPFWHFPRFAFSTLFNAQLFTSIEIVCRNSNLNAYGNSGDKQRSRRLKNSL